MTEDEFHAHWTRKHATLASAWLQRNGIIGYTQAITSETLSISTPSSQTLSSTIPQNQHTTMGMLRSVEDLKKAVEDPEYPEKVWPDEQRFMDQSNSVVTVGWEEVYVKDGKIVNIDEEGNSVCA
ncbi:hypothetical protein DL98DRAFT_583344 [Cadophora sp. DSE1049]|nr:hypothetical protein DL98DRAFT_583344 [Cadophora sp. DSE1049]